MKPKDTLIAIYVVSNTQDLVTLNLQIDPEEQTATSTIKLDDEMLYPKAEGNLNAYNVGKNKGLKEKKLIIATTVSNTTSNQVEQKLNLQLNGGIIPFSETLGEIVDAYGSAIYYIEIDFVGF